MEIALKLNAQSGNQRKESEQYQPNTQPHAPNKRGKAKEQKGKEGKCGAKAVKFAVLEMNECDTVIVEIPENEVNVETRQINLDNALGVGVWGNWANDWSIIIDTGFNGGGLRSYPWLRRYVEYMRSFYPKANLVKTMEKELGPVGICVWGSSRADVWR